MSKNALRTGNILRWGVALACCALSSFALAERAAEVVFVAGSATAAGKMATIGASVAEGETLTTGGDGYIYLRTADRGFFILRPNSEAVIQRYRFDPDHPEATQVKVVLTTGVMRTVTGAGVKAARQQFRFNTPVAAIGVRGTDFSVHTSAAFTRASVRTGGIVMAAFSGGCQSDGTGPCEGGDSEELFAHQKDAALLQIQSGDQKPQRLDDRYRHLDPDRATPPGLQEPLPVSTQPNLPPSPTVRSESGLLDRTPPPVPEPEIRHISWGRWQSLAGLDANFDPLNLPPGMTSVVTLPVFTLFRDAPPTGVLPREGKADFLLREHEGYFISGNQVLEAARAENASLSVDFATQQFETRMTLVGDHYSTSFNAAGSVDTDGRLVSNILRSNVHVQGALAGTSANQAGYLYQRAVTDTIKVRGATYWSR